jgi:hypothetical protein
MQRNRLIAIIPALFLVMIFANPGFSQKNPQEQIPEGKTPESSRIFVIGRIEYQQSEGGYFIRGDHPFGRIFRIANQNPEALEPLLKSGSKHINIDGRLTAGTNILFIEKINGQPYGDGAKPGSK